MLKLARGGGRGGWTGLFGRAQRGTEDDASASQAVYVETALAVLARWEELHSQWLTQIDEQRRNERLANAAAVYRWHLNALRERLRDTPAPDRLRPANELLQAVLDAAYHGTGLLSRGYRFHIVRCLCDGGLLLEEARAEAAAVRASLARLVPDASELVSVSEAAVGN